MCDSCVKITENAALTQLKTQWQVATCHKGRLKFVCVAKDSVENWGRVCRRSHTVNRGPLTRSILIRDQRVACASDCVRGIVRRVHVHSEVVVRGSRVWSSSHTAPASKRAALQASTKWWRRRRRHSTGRVGCRPRPRYDSTCWHLNPQTNAGLHCRY